MVAATREASRELKIVGLTCAAHSGNLLLQDFMRLYSVQLARVEALELFFRKSH